MDYAANWRSREAGDFPSPGPLIGVSDGGSIMSEQLTSAPSHRWQRLHKDWSALQPQKPG